MCIHNFVYTRKYTKSYQDWCTFCGPGSFGFCRDGFDNSSFFSKEISFLTTNKFLQLHIDFYNVYIVILLLAGAGGS